MKERNTLYKELIRLGQIKGRGFELDYFVGPIPAATIGFEFDIDWGASETEPPPSLVNNIDSKTITTHTIKKHGFRLKGDGPLIEIATEVFDITESGRTRMNSVLAKIKALTDEFETLCLSTPLHPGATSADYLTNTVSTPDSKKIGKPKCIQHATLVKNHKCKNSAIPDYTIKCIFPVQGSKTWYRQSLCYVRAAPQVTLAVPLSKIDEFISIIKASEKLPRIEFPLSGNAKFRMGLRSDALYNAKERVTASRNYHFRNKTKLADGTLVTESNYTMDLQGIMILMLSYLITGKLKYNIHKPGEDWEAFAKAYLPLNVKNHFRLIFNDLTDAEKQVFKELYFDGSGQLNFFKLADKSLYKDSAATIKTKVSDVTKYQLFPAKAVLGFGVFPTRPTWFSFLDMIVNNKPLIQAFDFSDAGCDPKSKKTDEVLFVPISKSIPYVTGSKRAVIEMRRIGTWMVPKEEWLKLCTKVFDIALKLNK